MGCCASEQAGLETERRQGSAGKVTKSGAAMGKGGKLPKLKYFSAYGLGEPIRMMLNHAGVPFEDIHIDGAQFREMKEKGELPGGQVPIWIDEQGRTFNQVKAIMIYLGKIHGYYPEDPWDAYEDDWALANHADLWGLDFGPKFLKDELEQSDIDHVVTKFEKWNKVVDKKLQDLGARKFIGGKKPTVGDFMTFSIYCNFVFNENTRSPAMRAKLQALANETPAVKAYVKRMQEENKAHLANRHKSSL